MEGKNFLNKMELLMSSLTSSQWAALQGTTGLGTRARHWSAPNIMKECWEPPSRWHGTAFQKVCLPVEDTWIEQLKHKKFYFMWDSTWPVLFSLNVRNLYVT
jgi:hypothetical protein